MDKKICQYKYIGGGRYQTECGKAMSPEQISEIDTNRIRYCPECGKAIEWPNPTRGDGAA